MLAMVHAYLALRRALGLHLKWEGVQLQSFARYVDRSGPGGPLTNRIAISWACLPKAVDRLGYGHGGLRSPVPLLGIW